MSALEVASIDVIREAVAGAKKLAMLYAMGKNSSVMLHLARVAALCQREVALSGLATR
jgi:3'-phosphoadenosine 5'-phosphosulfate sulfotransferase (PAPS reductase)/FAD synthetase